MTDVNATTSVGDKIKEAQGKAAAVKAAAAKKKVVKVPAAKKTVKAVKAVKAKIGGTRSWQKHLKPLREIVNLSISIRALEVKPSVTLMKEVSTHIKKCRDLLKTQGVTIPRKLQGKMDAALK